MSHTMQITIVHSQAILIYDLDSSISAFQREKMIDPAKSANSRVYCKSVSKGYLRYRLSSPSIKILAKLTEEFRWSATKDTIARTAATFITA